MADFSITGEVKLNSDPAERSTSKWTVAAGNMIADFAKKAASSLASVVKSGIDYNTTMEKYLTNFKVMLGDEEAAAAKLEEIRKMAASTPFTMPQLTDATQTLLQFGITADDTTDVLQRLGDISLGNSSKLETLTRAYGKMSSAQKVTLENVNMMIDAGFNPLNQICDATGETMSDLYKRISDGKVSFSELEAAVVSATSEGGQFFNGMAEASQTFSGRMATMQENVTALVGELTSGLFASLGNLIDIINSVATSFLDSDEKMDALKETVARVTSAIVAATAAFAAHKAVLNIQNLYAAVTKAMNGMTVAQYAATSAQKLLNAAFVANPLGAFLTVVAGVTAALVTAYQTSEKFQDIVNGVVTSVKQWWQKELGSILDWLDDMKASVQAVCAAMANLKNGVAAAKQAYNEAYAAALSEQNAAKLEKERQRRQQLHNERIRQAQEETAAVKAAAATSAEAIELAAGTAEETSKNAGNAIEKASVAVLKSVTDTTTEVEGSITRTTETVTETLSDGTTRQKQIITETGIEMVGDAEKNVKTVTTIAADGSETITKTLEDVEATVKETVTSTSTALVDGVETTVKTVTKTLTDGKAETEQVITEVQDAVIDGALVTIERVRTIAADGTETVTQTIKESALNDFDGLWKELQDRADTGVLGTFDTLYNAVQQQDWAGVGKWAAATLYDGLSADRKEQIESFALGLIDQLNGVLKGAQAQVSAAAWDIGESIYRGVTSGFAEILSQADQLGSALQASFETIKGPLSTAAKAISDGLSGGLLSAFPSIYAAMGGLITSIGAAFEGMLSAISTALSATVFGIPAGVLVAGAAVALGVAIAAVVAKLGGKKGSTSGSGSAPSTPSTGSGGGNTGSSSGSLGGDITVTPDADDLQDTIQDATDRIEDLVQDNTDALLKTNAALADMVRQANALVLSDNMRISSTVAASGTAQIRAAADQYHTSQTIINQTINSKAQTAADLARETRWEADRALAQKR